MRSLLQMFLAGVISVSFWACDNGKLQTGGENWNPDDLPTACSKFDSYLDEKCVLLESTTAYWVDGCAGYSEAFVGDFMDALVVCLTAQECYYYDTEQPTDEENPLHFCFANTAKFYPQSDKNIVLQEHYCDLLLECGYYSTADECEGYELNVSAMQFFNVLRDPIVDAIDSCVYPMPSCEFDFKACIDAVLDDYFEDYYEIAWFNVTVQQAISGPISA